MLNYSNLKSRQIKERGDQPEALKVRIHRALSWLQCSESQEQDPDVKFISLWISFNAAYGVDSTVNGTISSGDQYNDFIAKIIGLDNDGLIGKLIWEHFTNSIRVILDNKYIYQPFWNFQNGQSNFTHWEESFKASRINAQKLLINKDLSGLLSIVFSRLYTLRNQIIHGGASWNSRLNRNQVSDANKLLSSLVPIIIKIMMDNPKEYWSPVSYPVQR